MCATVGGFFLFQERAQLAFMHERETRRIAGTAVTLVTDRETGILDYELTHDQKSLVPEIVARVQLPSLLDSLATLTKSNPENSDRFKAISVALNNWEKHFAEPAVLGSVKGIGTLNGKLQFDQVRAAFETFLAVSESDVRREAARVTTLQILGTAVVLAELLAFVGMLLFVIRGQLMHQARELTHQQELLEQQAVELKLQMAELQATNDSLAEREDRLQKSEERYRYAAQLSNDAIYDWDVATNRFEWNEGLQGLFGYPANEIGTTIEWLVSLLHPDDTDRVMRSFYEVFNKGGASRWKAEYRLRRKDGKYANAEGRAYIIRAADGSPKRVIGAISDHTQQQSLEGQLRQSQKMEAIGRLAGGIAHDFNNVLTVIRMSSEFILTEMPEADDKYQDAQEIIKASDRASKLTRQLLAFSRHQVLNPTIVSMNEIVRGMDGMIRRVLPENIDFVADLATDLRSVKADTGQMEQVLLNLVINASDAMPEGGKLSVRTSNATLDATFRAKHLNVPPGQHVCLTVTDTGIGMDEETIARIFEPFFTTKGVGKGTGLGLSTVHGIVTQSGGTIWVYSEPALGTTFKVFLPKSEGISTPTSTRIAEEQTEAPTETILLVEDEESTRVAISRNLTRVGYTVIDAINGVEALSRADSYPGTIDLLLTDSMMPEMGGAQLVSHLRERRSGINVLMMSGYTEGIGASGESGEREAFIEKPFSTADLLLAIRSALRAGS